MLKRESTQTWLTWNSNESENRNVTTMDACEQIDNNYKAMVIFPKMKKTMFDYSI